MWGMLQQKMEANPNWIRDMWFSDKTHFHINGAISSHNNIFWGSQLPDEVEEKSLLRVGKSLLLWLSASEVYLGRIGLKTKTEER